MTSSLSIDVFNSGYKPVPGGPKWDGKTPATWPASTSTLISGDRQALLVDALMTVEEGERLAEWVKSSRRHPGAILVTHGHADHFFGAGPVLDTFPGAHLVASDQRVVDEARSQTAPKVMVDVGGYRLQAREALVKKAQEAGIIRISPVDAGSQGFRDPEMALR